MAFVTLFLRKAGKASSGAGYSPAALILRFKFICAAVLFTGCLLGLHADPSLAGESEPGDVHSGGANSAVHDRVVEHGDQSTGNTASFIAICYHDVQDKDPDQRFDGVTTSKLIQQLSWFQQNGYHPVSFDDILAARAGTRPLPSKAILLTFDDGYVSFYTRAFPILKAFNYPAVIGIVEQWLTGPQNGMVTYGNAKLARSAFMTWDQIREVQRSGLVEVAAHTAYLHTGIPANPQGNSEPSAVTAAYDPLRKNYETSTVQTRRIAGDARSISDIIQRQTGRRPRAVIWPYGEYSGQAITLYGAAGMPITFSLDDGTAKLLHLEATPRILIVDDPNLEDYVPDVYHINSTRIVRVAHVDLDYVYDADPAQQDRNLGALIQRIHDLDIDVVYLQAFADPSGSGTVREVYFPNRLLHMRSDLFNRAVWQLRTRAGVSVYAWLPVLSYDFGARRPTQVQTWDPKTKTVTLSPDPYHRLSPFDPQARELIGELYEDAARSSGIQGILFHDDAELSDFEDASPPALAAYRNAGLPDSIEQLRNNPTLRREWTEFKTNALIEFTQELANRVRKYRSPIKTARNIYSRPVLEPASEDWMAQNFDRFLQSYDYTAIEAMPLMENVDPASADDWLTHLVEVVKSHPNALSRTVFELQSVDWRKDAHSPDRIVGTQTLVDEMRLIQRLGALNFGYYPDDFLHDQPNGRLLHTAISLQSYEYKK